MKFVKKWGILLVVIIFLAIIGALVFTWYRAKTYYENTIADYEYSVADMQSFIENDIGDLITCYVATKPIRVGDIVTPELLQEVQIPEKVAYTNKEVLIERKNDWGQTYYETSYEKSLAFVDNINDIINKKFRVNLDEGSLIMTDFIVDEILQDSERYFQLIMDEYPVDIKAGDYVDIRIQLTYGQDFIALPHKRVERLDLENGLFTFVFNESEINTYNSMLLDSAMYPAVKIYALKYIDTDQQVSAEAYYPINKNIAEILAINPNILDLVQKEMALEREQLNAIMGGDIETFDDRELDSVQREIESYRRTLNQDISSAIRNRVNTEKEAERIAALSN